MNNASFPLPKPTDPFPADWLIELYVARECTLTEQAAIERWIAANPESGALLQMMRSHSEGEASLAGAGAEILEAVQAVVARIPAIAQSRRGDHGVRRTPELRLRSSGRSMRGWRYTSLRTWTIGVGIAAIGTVMTLLLVGPSSKSNLAQTERLYTTTTGQQASLTLSDGTHVVLAPRTTLRVLVFGTQTRTVALDGEAYFDVTQSSGVPFVVQSGGVMTRVLGTTFFVKHYARDSHVRVSVATGKVAVMARAPLRPNVTLTAGHVADVTDSTATVKTVNNVNAESGWLNGMRLFNNAPLTDVLATLTRWYGYEFRYTDSTIVQQNVTLGLSLQSSSEALATLTRVLGLNVAVAGDTITLTQARTHGTPAPRRKHYDVWTPTREVGR